jgi:hypothetical protein
MIASRMVNLKVKNKKPGAVPGNPAMQPGMMSMGQVMSPDMSQLKSMNMSSQDPGNQGMSHIPTGPTMVGSNMVNANMMKMSALQGKGMPPQNTMMMQV